VLSSLPAKSQICWSQVPECCSELIPQTSKVWKFENQQFEIYSWGKFESLKVWEFETYLRKVWKFRSLKVWKLQIFEVYICVGMLIPSAHCGFAVSFTGLFAVSSKGFLGPGPKGQGPRGPICFLIPSAHWGFAVSFIRFFASIIWILAAVLGFFAASA
jgi:hypothetical protein